MAKKPDNTDPSVPSNAYVYMFPKWQMVETLLEGTDAMRLAGQTYLPKHDEESAGNYSERLAVTTLFNMFELTLESLVSRPFSEVIEVPDEADKSITALFKDIDLQGATLDTFCRKWFREGTAKGLAHVLIDMPTISQPPVGVLRTKADDDAEARRPNWILVKPECLLFAYAEYEGGKEVLKQIRISQCETVMDGFLEVVKQQVKIVESPLPGDSQCTYRVFELQKDVGKKEKWVEVSNGYMDIDEIPLVTYYANRKDFMISKPPLEDLAYLNVRHWQSTSDQISILTIARYPMLAASGVSESAGGKMAVGPRQLLTMKDPTGKFYYVEHEGKAIAAGRQDLMDIEEAMANYGAECLRRTSGNATATASALNSSEAISPLEAMVKGFNVDVNRAIAVTSKWIAGSTPFAVEIEDDFGPDGIIDADLRTLVASLQSHAISTETYLKELQRRGLLDDKLDPKTEVAAILKEGHMPGVPTPSGPGRPDGSKTGGDSGTQGTGKGSGGQEVSGTGGRL